MPPDNPGLRHTWWLRSEKPWDVVMGRGFESPHLHHCRRPLACGFSYLDHLGGTVGPRRSRLRLRADPFPDLLEALAERAEFVWVQVPHLRRLLTRVVSPRL